MATEQLTTAKLKSLSDDDVGTMLTDGGGLRGRVRRDRGGKIIVPFEYKYRSGNQFRTVKVAQWPSCSLAEIRSRFREIKTELSKGHDPIDARKADKLQNELQKAQQIENTKLELQRLASEAAARRTFADAISQWETLELSRRKDGGKEAMRAINKDVMPILADVALADVTRAMLVSIFDGVVTRGARVMANQLFGDLRQFFNFAMAREWIESHPLARLSKDKIGGRQKERDRYLSEDEIMELNTRLPSASMPRTTELAIWLMLSTCCRVGELSQARWEHIDFEKGEWLIPASNSKNAKNHTVFLSDFAKALLLELHTITSYSAWCLPSSDGNNPIHDKTISKQIKDRVRTTPLANRSKATATLLLSGGAWTPHDLRRTGATLMGELGVIGEVIERCLNHVEQNKLKRTYQRHELKAEQREAWHRLGDRLTILAAPSKHNNVVIGKFIQAG